MWACGLWVGTLGPGEPVESALCDCVCLEGLPLCLEVSTQPWVCADGHWKGHTWLYSGSSMSAVEQRYYLISCLFFFLPISIYLLKKTLLFQ